MLPAHGSAPEVMGPQIPQGCVGPEVLVVHDGTDIVEDESAIEGIAIDH